MPDFAQLSGVYAAAITPLKPGGEPELEAIPAFLERLARRGCHGALMLGTTGEGPSFNAQERLEIFTAATTIRQVQPGFRLFAGTGTPSLEETITLTRGAFDLGFDGVVVLPPYYFRKVSEDGLFAWFSEVFRRAVPAGGAVFYYHIPNISGISVSMRYFARLLDSFPGRFAGLKDSSADPDQARQLGEQFGSDLVTLNGTDRLFSMALEQKASGCITALANLASPELRQVWDSHVERLQGTRALDKSEPNQEAQKRLDAARDVLDRYPPAAPLLKAIAARWFDLPVWPVRLPLLPMRPELADRASEEMKAALCNERSPQ